MVEGRSNGFGGWGSTRGGETPEAYDKDSQDGARSRWIGTAWAAGTNNNLSEAGAWTKNSNSNYLIMGDRSPKDVKKQAAQKHVKDDAKEHEKEVVTEAQHHPVSGHPATSEELAASES